VDTGEGFDCRTRIAERETAEGGGASVAVGEAGAARDAASGKFEIGPEGDGGKKCGKSFV
jgi:hypothetical protein